MPINPTIQTNIQTDINTGPDSHNYDFLRDQGFWDWFIANASLYTRCIDEDPTFTNDQYRPGNCFGNSQQSSITHELLYCEGFVYFGGTYHFHGFNMRSNCVIDCTAQSNPETYNNGAGAQPYQYVGKIKPNDFIIANSEYRDGHNLNIPPLIYVYYQSITNN